MISLTNHDFQVSVAVRSWSNLSRCIKLRSYTKKLRFPRIHHNFIGPFKDHPRWPPPGDHQTQRVETAAHQHKGPPTPEARGEAVGDLVPLKNQPRRPGRGGFFQVSRVGTRPGKHTKNDGKSPFLMGKIHYKWPGKTNITMENHHVIAGKIHYFDWAIFNSYVKMTRGYQQVASLWNKGDFMGDSGISHLKIGR